MSPSISRRELIRKFKALGFSGPYSGGRHQFMIRGRQKIRIPNPHGSSDVDKAMSQKYGYPLKIAFSKENDKIVVITAYPLRRGRRL